MAAEIAYLTINVIGAVAAVAFLLDAIRSATISRRQDLHLAWGLSVGQEIAGMFFLARFLIAVWLGILAVAHSPIVTEVAVLSLVAIDAATMMAMIVIWISKYTVIRR